MEEIGMTGLFLLVVVFAWLLAVVFLTSWLMKHVKIKLKPIRIAVAILIFVLLLPLPLADEIIGGYQFRELCKQGAVLRIDAEKSRGQTMKLVIEPSNEILPGTAITIYHSHLTFQNVNTGEEIASYDTYVAKGGWFIRTLGISEGNAPITIGLPSCSPPMGAHGISKAYSFTLIDPIKGR
jgi:hypothetical protein